MTRCNVLPLSFYNRLGDDGHDYDRGYPMTDSLRAWIASTLEDDPRLAEEAIVTHLGAILKKNPHLIASTKNAIVAAEEYNMPYKTVFVSKVTGEVFENQADAEASISGFLDAGIVGFDKCFDIRHTANGAYVNEAEVEAYIENFDGDKESLCRQLHVEPAKAKSGKDKKAKA